MVKGVQYYIQIIESKSGLLDLDTITESKKQFETVAAMGGIFQFLRGQFTTPAMPQADLTGRTIIVTGGNSGLGLDAAKLLVRLNCSKIILACRNISKAETAKASVESTTHPSGEKPKVEILQLDLASFSSVSAFAKRCKDLPRLDGAILNAGVHMVEWDMAEGYETDLTVNVISTFFLTTLLVPILRDSAKKHNNSPTIAVVGSAVHFWANHGEFTTAPEGQILTSLSEVDPKSADMKARYYLSKLGTMLMVKHIASLLTESARLDPVGKPLVVINNVAPGLCRTNLFRENKDTGINIGLKLIGRPSEVGARTLVHGGAVAGKESHGQYLSECMVKSYSPFVKSSEGDQTARRLWMELVAIYERLEPGCTREL